MVGRNTRHPEKPGKNRRKKAKKASLRPR